MISLGITRPTAPVASGSSRTHEMNGTAGWSSFEDLYGNKWDLVEPR